MWFAATPVRMPAASTASATSTTTSVSRPVRGSVALGAVDVVTPRVVAAAVVVVVARSVTVIVKVSGSLMAPSGAVNGRHGGGPVRLHS